MSSFYRIPPVRTPKAVIRGCPLRGTRRSWSPGDLRDSILLMESKKVHPILRISIFQFFEFSKKRVFCDFAKRKPLNITKNHPQEPPDPPRIIGLGGFLVFCRRKLDASFFSSFYRPLSSGHESWLRSQIILKLVPNSQQQCAHVQSFLPTSQNTMLRRIQKGTSREGPPGADFQNIGFGPKSRRQGILLDDFWSVGHQIL